MTHLKSWIQAQRDACRAAFQPLLAAHASQIKQEAPDTYGYAVVLGSEIHDTTPRVWTQSKGALKNIRHRDALLEAKYYPDEWKSRHEPFADFAKLFEQTHAEFREHHPKGTEDYYDDTEWDFLTAMYQAYLGAMKDVKAAGGFEGYDYLIIWIADSYRDIKEQSFWALNEGNTLQEGSEFFPEPMEMLS